MTIRGADRSVRIERHGRRVDRPDPVFRHDSLGLGTQLRREVDEIVDLDALMSVAQSVGIGCVGEYHSPGTLPCGTGRSSIGQIGSPVSRFNTNSRPCFVACASALMVLPSFTASTSIGAVGMS